MYSNEKEINYKRKKSSKFFRIIFSRFYLILFAVILEFIILYNFLINVSSNLTIGSIIIYDFITILVIINSNFQKDDYKFIWIIVLVLFPGVGVLLYFIYWIDTKFNYLNKKINNIKYKTSLYAISNENDFLVKLPYDEIKSFFTYMYKNQKFFPFFNNTTKYFNDGKKFFDDVLSELRNAKNNIFIEFFIIEDGVIWQEIQKILIEKALIGLDIKIIYDGLNIINNFSISGIRKLKKYGIEVKSFAPIIPLLSSTQNHRDHRKIIVIDDKVAYTGGINIGDEYANYYQKYGVWKDASIKVSGSCARSFSLYFLLVFMLSKKDKEQTFSKYLPYNILNDNMDIDSSNSYVCAYTDFPNDNEDVTENLYKMMINYSYSYLYIMTPYLVLNESMIATLVRCVKRGVDIKIVLPHIPDKLYVHIVSRSNYKKLLLNGIKIFEFEKGFIHSKIFLSDDIRAIVGTANFDYRSLYLHYEDGIYLYNDTSIKDIKNDFEETFNECIEIKDYKQIPLWQRLFGSILKIFAPQF